MKNTWLGFGVLALAIGVVGCGGDNGGDAMNGSDAGVDSSTIDDSGSTQDDGATPDMAVLDMATADMSTPDMDALDMATADMSTPDMDAPRTSLSFAELPRAYGEVLCEQRACLEFEQSVGSELMAVGTGDDCVERAGDYLKMMIDIEWLEALMDAGVLTYDGEAAFACIDALAASYCGARIPTCVGTAFRGTGRDGDACQLGLFNTCGEGLGCRRPSGVDWVCGGECVPVVAKGEPCDSANDCTQTADGNGRCEMRRGDIEPRCHEYVTVEVGPGELCNRGFEEEEEYVLRSIFCGPGLVCQGVEHTGVCVNVEHELIPIGETCRVEGSQFASCESGAFCGDDVCLPVVLETTTGIDCGVTEDTVVLCDAYAGVVCLPNSALSGECLPFGDGTVGAVCMRRTPFLLNGGCGEGLYCPDDFDFLPFGSECTERKNDGVACDRNEECLSNFCDRVGSVSICVVPHCSPDV